MISVETVSPWWKTFTSRTGPLATQHHFVVLQQVADAFIQSGSLDPTIRRQYAQALLDQGILKAAIAVLELLGTGFLVDGPRA
jgi:hypothetical protein